jgi:hypothetical protein
LISPLTFVGLLALLPSYAIAADCVDCQSVPTISVYGLVALAGGMAAVGAWKQRRRNK